MSASTTKLLQAAVEILGGAGPLAERLGISRALLSAYLHDARPLPDSLLLRAVDIIFEDRQARFALDAQSTSRRLNDPAAEA